MMNEERKKKFSHLPHALFPLQILLLIKSFFPVALHVPLIIFSFAGMKYSMNTADKAIFI
jgi:hypothetical protein